LASGCSSEHCRTAGHGCARGGPRAAARREPPHGDQQQAEHQEHLLSPLQVRQKLVVEHPAGGAEDGAGEVVDEELSADGQGQGQQQGVRRESHADDHGHPRFAPREGQGGHVQGGDEQDQPLGHRVRKGVDGARLLQLRRVHEHDLPVLVRDRHPVREREAASDQALLDLLDDL